MKYNKIVVKAVCIVAAIAISVGTIWDFSSQLQHALTSETYRTLSEVSADYNKAFLDRISYEIKTMKVISGSLEQLRGQEKRDTMRVLQNGVDYGGFAKLVACDARGISCSNDGVSRDISHHAYFQQAMRGEINASAPLRAVVDGEESLVIAVPIQSGGEIGGILFGVYPLDTAGTQLMDFSYYSEGYGFVVDTDGSIVLSSEHADKLCMEENLFSFFEKTDLTGFSVAAIKAAVAAGESKSFSFAYNGARRLVTFTPTTVNDWYTFSIAADAPMLQQEKVTMQIVQRLVLKLTVVAVLLFGWTMLRNRRHNKEILEASQKYQSLLAHINGGMIVAVHAETADETIVTYVSSGFTDMTGYTLEDIQTLHHGRYLDVIAEEDRKAVFAIYLEQLAVGPTYHMPYRIRKKDGALLWVMDNGYLVEDEDGLHNHSIIADITVIKQQEEALRLSESRFSLAINASSGTLVEVDLKRQLYTHFENAERIFGTDAETLLAATRAFSTLPHAEFVEAVLHYFFHPDDQPIVEDALATLRREKTVSYEARLRRLDGGYLWCRIDLSLSVDDLGVPTSLVGFMSDIDGIKKQAEQLESKVQTDPMTGLYNKIAMETLTNKVLKECVGKRHALIVLDIDNFKGINDTLGHAFGDLVLIEACTKLKTMFRSNDLVGRMGGDEFAILLRDVPDTSSVLKKTAELSRAFRQTYAGEKEVHRISCSMGVIMIGTSCDTFETLYRKADAALYLAKQRGKDQFALYRERDADNYLIETTRTNDEERQNLKVAYSVEAQIFELLYTAKDFNISINMALAAIGQHYHVSRVSIFENSEDNLTTSNIYEWCNDGVVPQISTLSCLKLTSGAESVMDCFDSAGLLYCNDIRDLPPYLRQILASKGVLSTLKVTIANDERTCGFIGFDACDEHRIWTAEEIEKLSFLAKVLSVFLFKKRAEDSLVENLHTRLKILDILPDYICVVNPETHVLEYTNKKMQALLPAARPGAFCFTTLHGGQRAPCQTCLIERIKSGDTENLEILGADEHTRLKVSAISIDWAKNQTMVLLYGGENKTP